jgi:hypothetical protein
MNMYYGPTDSKILKQYDKNLEESIPFGWGIFGWISWGFQAESYGNIKSGYCTGKYHGDIWIPGIELQSRIWSICSPKIATFIGKMSF